MMDKGYFFSREGNLLSYTLNNGMPQRPIIVLVHGFTGNKHENGLFVESDTFFKKQGYNVFRFDMTGVGESTGEFMHTSLEQQVSDLSRALDYIKKEKYPCIGLIGFSLGATVSLLTNLEGVDALALWSPALFPSRDMFPRYDTKEVRRELLEKGYISKAGLKVGSTIINDLRTCDLVPAMRGLQKPVLLLHGTADPRIDYRNTQGAVGYFPNASLQLIDGANHSYKGNDIHRMEVLTKTCDWFDKQLSR